MIKLEIDDRRFNEYIRNAKNFFDTDLMDDIGNECVNFFKDSFIKEGWHNITFEPWKKVRDKEGKILINRGNLRRSIRISSIDNKKVEIIADEKYAKIHNEGGTIKVNDNMRKLFWHKYKKTNNEKWKALALTDTINIPQRQFMGESETLNDEIEKIIFDKWKRI